MGNSGTFTQQWSEEFLQEKTRAYKILTSSEFFFILRFNSNIAQMKMYRNTRCRSLKISLHYGSYLSESRVASTFYSSKGFIFNKVLYYKRMVLRSLYSGCRGAGRSWEWIPVRATFFLCPTRPAARLIHSLVQWVPGKAIGTWRWPPVCI